MVSMPGDHYQMDLHVFERDPIGTNRTLCVLQCIQPLTFTSIIKELNGRLFSHVNHNMVQLYMIR